MSCEHKHTVHSELKGLTHFELCINCGQSRAEWETGTTGWSHVEDSKINIVRQFRKIPQLQAELDKANEDVKLCKFMREILNQYTEGNKWNRSDEDVVGMIWRTLFSDKFLEEQALKGR